MKPAPEAVEFRRKAVAAHLTLQEPYRDEERFVFELVEGSMTLPQHPEYVRRLIDLAEEVCGCGQGEHAELLGLAAERASLEDVSGLSVEVRWRQVNPAQTRASPHLWVDLHAWIEDQFLMEEAMEKLPEPPLA